MQPLTITAWGSNSVVIEYRTISIKVTARGHAIEIKNMGETEQETVFRKMLLKIPHHAYDDMEESKTETMVSEITILGKNQKIKEAGIIEN